MSVLPRVIHSNDCVTYTEQREKHDKYLENTN